MSRTEAAKILKNHPISVVPVEDSNGDALGGQRLIIDNGPEICTPASRLFMDAIYAFHSSSPEPVLMHGMPRSQGQKNPDRYEINVLAIDHEDLDRKLRELGHAGITGEEVKDRETVERERAEISRRRRSEQGWDR